MNRKFVFFGAAGKSRCIDKGCLSQWFLAPFKVDGVKYARLGQYLLAEKARLFGDEDQLKKILVAKSLLSLKALGRNVAVSDPKKWDEVRPELMVKGNAAKFTQNPDLLAFLMGTGKSLLVEVGPENDVWGNVLKKDGKIVLDPEDWRGKNLLGEALMRVRSDLVGTDVAQVACTERTKSFDAGVCAVEDEEVLTARLAPRKTSQANVGMTTRLSTVLGLLSSPTSRKWEKFFRDGPYWTYLTNFIRQKNIFHGREYLVEEAVTDACTNVSRFLCERRYVYPDVGKGYFRGFLKLVAFHAALDVLRRSQKYEYADAKPRDPEDHDDMAQLQADMEDVNEGDNDAIEDRQVSERELDIYDSGSIADRTLASVNDGAGSKTGPVKRKRAICSLSGSQFSDDPEPLTYDPASFFDYIEAKAEEDRVWLRKLQVHVLYIALGHLLSNTRKSVARREMLRLRIGRDMAPKDIRARPAFVELHDGEFNVKMHNAVEDLRREVRCWWALVEPRTNDFADDKVLELWRGLLDDRSTRMLGKKLRKKAEEEGGVIE